MYRKPYYKKKVYSTNHKSRGDIKHKGSPAGFLNCSCRACRYGRSSNYGKSIYNDAKGAYKTKDRIILHLYTIRGDEIILDKLENNICTIFIG